MIRASAGDTTRGGNARRAQRSYLYATALRTPQKPYEMSPTNIKYNAYTPGTKKEHNVLPGTLVRIIQRILRITHHIYDGLSTCK